GRRRQSAAFRLKLPAEEALFRQPAGRQDGLAFFLRIAPLQRPNERGGDLRIPIGRAGKRFARQLGDAELLFKRQQIIVARHSIPFALAAAFTASSGFPASAVFAGCASAGGPLRPAPLLQPERGDGSPPVQLGRPPPPAEGLRPPAAAGRRR